MINLLPPKEKKLLQLEIKKRLFLVLWLLFLFFLFSFILILFSIKFYLASEIESEKISAKKAENLREQSEFEVFEKKINSFNETFEKMDSFYNQKIYFSEALNRVSGFLPQNSYLKSISLNFLEGQKGEKTIQVALSGFISDRESLFDFKKALEKEQDIKEISFPASNWIKPTDIDFSVTFKIFNQ